MADSEAEPHNGSVTNLAEQYSIQQVRLCGEVPPIQKFVGSLLWSEKHLR